MTPSGADQARALREKKTAVFMDAGAVFFAARDIHENQQLAYPALMDLLAKKGFHLPSHSDGDDNLWVMWSSAVAQNPGQTRFLQYAERELHWRVRRFRPADGYMVDPVNVGLTGETRNRLLRFDASIAFAIGRFAESHRIAVVTDSFAVAEPLLKAAQLGGHTNVIAFFSRLLDPRWQSLLRVDDRQREARGLPGARPGQGGELARVPIEHLDLDDYEGELFGAPKPRETTGWNDDFLLTK